MIQKQQKIKRCESCIEIFKVALYMQILTVPMQAIIIYFFKDISFRYSACSASILNKNALKSSSAWKQKENIELKSSFAEWHLSAIISILFN